MRVRALLAAATPLAMLLVTGLAAGPASAASTEGPAPDYEMPFPCGQSWTGTSRANHSPSPLSVDFNRPDDDGDPMVAAAAGVVTRVADLGSRSYGKYLIVDHGDGETTLYAHLKSTWAVQGQSVDQGTVLGLVGGTGAVTGPHLHFEERLDGTDRPAWFHQAGYVLGTTQASANCPDVPLAGDWNHDGSDEVAVFRRAVHARFRLASPGAASTVLAYGRSTDQPVTGDWDGDGTTDVGVRRPGWRAFLLRQPDGSTVQVTFGRVRDTAVTGDWDGDGHTDLGLWDPLTGTFTLRGADGSTGTVALGSGDDHPVTGDWNGDGRTDLGVFDPGSATYSLRVVDGDGTVWTAAVPFGSVHDLPVTGDWDGDGRTDLGVWTPTTATYLLRTSSPTTARTAGEIRALRYGRPR